MTLQELLPEIKTLNREDKTEIFNYLLKDLGAEEDYLVGCLHNPEIVADTARQLMELMESEKAKV